MSGHADLSSLAFEPDFADRPPPLSLVLRNGDCLDLTGRQGPVRGITILYLEVEHTLRDPRDGHTAPTRARYTGDSHFRTARTIGGEQEWHCRDYCCRSQTLFLPARAIELSRPSVLRVSELDHGIINRQSRGGG